MTDHNFKNFYKFSESILCYKDLDKLEIRFCNIEIVKPRLLNYVNSIPQTKGFDLAYIEKNWMLHFHILGKLSYDYGNPIFVNILKHLERCYENL